MASDDNIKKGAALLHEGELVAFPTETVYGLGGNALSDTAVALIYEAKGRPQFNPLIVHVASLAEARRHATFNHQAELLAQHFWPGPLTLVLPRTPGCALSLLVSAGLDTVALRMPAHTLARALLEESRLPIAAPSANRSGHVSPTLAEHVQQELGNRVAMILDGGACAVGIESTVVDVSGELPVILRPGSITEEQLESVIGEVRRADKSAAITSPGMLERHYAPSHPLRLNAKEVRAGEALLAFGVPVAGAGVMENLSESGDLQEAAANLFRMLRTLDASAVSGIAVMPIPESGLGVAINDRLRRAATPG
jgi:L-threonylcarbamoyladenylate synthase